MRQKFHAVEYLPVPCLGENVGEARVTVTQPPIRTMMPEGVTTRYSGGRTASAAERGLEPSLDRVLAASLPHRRLGFLAGNRL